jgi:excinuclease UvrABC helicase subunit UvrB
LTKAPSSPICRRQRIVCGTRPICWRCDLSFRRIDAARNLRDLAGQIGRATRQIGDLVAEIGTITQAIADRIEERHARQRSQRHHGRGAGIQVESEIEHRAYRDSDKHDTGRDEDSADTSHSDLSWADCRGQCNAAKDG